MKTVFLFICLIYALIPTNAEIRTLALLDNFTIKETHSIFFQSLKDIGHSVSFKLADDSTLALSKYDELLYDNLILFSPNVEEFGGRIDKDAILDFIDSGGNILVATGSKPGNLIRELGTECGIEVDISGNTLIDHFNYDISDEFNHTLVVIDPRNLINAPVMVQKSNVSPILYRGGCLLVNDTSSLVLPVLNAYSTSYSYNPNQPMEAANSKMLNLIGKDIALIVATQTRNNQRIIFSGSLYMFSDDAFASSVSKVGGDNYEKSGNQELCISLLKWVFKETGVIRVKSVSYQKSNEPGVPSGFTVMDTALFTMELEQKQGDNWIPFDTNDIQLEFVRIDPFIRTYMPRVASGKYQVVFQIPDIYGVFKFKVDYKRIGYTSVFSSTQVSVRPLKHTEYERFIGSAYPYYMSAFSMMFGVFLFIFMVLHYDTDGKDKRE